MVILQLLEVYSKDTKIRKGCFHRTDDYRLTCLGSELLGCRVKASESRKQEVIDKKRLKLKSFINNGGLVVFI